MIFIYNIINKPTFYSKACPIIGNGSWYNTPTIAFNSQPPTTPEEYHTLHYPTIQNAAANICKIIPRGGRVPSTMTPQVENLNGQTLPVYTFIH